MRPVSWLKTYRTFSIGRPYFSWTCGKPFAPGVALACVNRPREVR